MAGNQSYSNLTDEALLLAYRKSGDNTWLGYLLPRYTALLLGVAMKYLKDKTLAEDAVQQVFLKVLTHLPAEEIANFKGWLYVLMRNLCLQQLRDQQHKTGNPMPEELAAPADHREELLQQELTMQHMQAALEQLNEEQRISITMFYFEQQSYEQITGKTGFTFMQVKSFIQNGKRNLKALILKNRRS